MLAKSSVESVQSERNNRKRLSPQAYQITKALLTKAQQGLCGICHEPGIEEIDHINGDPGDNHPDNLRGVHKSCNIRQRNLQLAKSRDSDHESASIGLDGASAEIEISREKEPMFRKCLFERTGKAEPLFSQEAIYGIAEMIGASPITTRRYLGKAVSPQGPYELVTVKSGNRMLKQVVPK